MESLGKQKRVGLLFHSRNPGSDRATSVVPGPRGPPIHSLDDPLMTDLGHAKPRAREGPRDPWVLRGLPRLCELVGATAIVVILGWMLGLETAKRGFPGLASMKLNTAVCLLLAATGVRLDVRGPARGSRRGRFRPGIVAALSLVVGLTSVEYATGLDLAIDQVLVRDAGHDAIPGRMSFLSATGFTLLAATLALPRATGGLWAVLAATLPTVGLGLSLLVTIGYIYGVELLYRPLPTTSMAIHTAGCFLLLFSALMASRSSAGWGRLLSLRGPVGVISRGLLPTLTFLPIVIGGFFLVGFHADLYGTRELAVLLTVATVALVSSVLWMSLRRAALVHEQLEERRRVLAALLELSLLVAGRKPGPGRG